MAIHVTIRKLTGFLLWSRAEILMSLPTVSFLRAPLLLPCLLLGRPPSHPFASPSLPFLRIEQRYQLSFVLAHDVEAYSQLCRQ